MQLEQLATYLEDLARTGKPTTYESIAARFGLPPLDGVWNAHPLSRAFDTLDREDAEARRPYRTSLVISKTRNMPGPGYFASLAALKGVRPNKKKDEAAIFLEELKAATEYPW